MPFEDSRRLTGSNLFFDHPGAVLELAELAAKDSLSDGWRARVQRVRLELGWPDLPMAVRLHAGGASFALAAPLDQLFTATEINEWAVCATLIESDAKHWSGLEIAWRRAALEESPERVSDDLPVLAEFAAMARFARLSKSEANPRLLELVEAAVTHQLSYVLDETTLTLGAGVGGRSYSLNDLPYSAEIAWAELFDIPIALVTGSNGKTTTVRLLAACAKGQGWRAGYNSTEGVWVGDQVIVYGDYAGPVGTRMVLRDVHTAIAILEVARGGILRRGIAASRAQVAIVTNVTADHFGEYGIDDLSALADVKLSVAALLGITGLLVLNADDALLSVKATELTQRFGAKGRLAWFALDADHPTLQAHRDRGGAMGGGATCGVRSGRLRLSLGTVPGSRGIEHDLGVVAAMPLSVAGVASYNIANLAAAALAAAELGIAPTTIATVFAYFGADVQDNLGRMMRFEVRGVHVIVDYAHNPAGLRGLLAVAQGLRVGGRLGLILGHAGNRQDADLAALAKVAAEFEPHLVVVKENETQLRGRTPGEIPLILHEALRRFGVPDAALASANSEVEAARMALDWARAGDVLILPIHGVGARATIVELLTSGAEGKE